MSKKNNLYDGLKLNKDVYFEQDAKRLIKIRKKNTKFLKRELKENTNVVEF